MSGKGEIKRKAEKLQVMEVLVKIVQEIKNKINNMI